MSASSYAPTVATYIEPITVPIPIISAPMIVSLPERGPRPMGRTLTTVSVLGRFVTLAALLVLAGAVWGLVDGVPADDVPTVVATIGGSGH